MTRTFRCIRIILIGVLLVVPLLVMLGAAWIALVYIGRRGSCAVLPNGYMIGYTVEVPVIVLPVLQATLGVGPCGDLTFIVVAAGQPFTKERFGNKFRTACRAAGVPGSAHGVRKLAATRMAENGATEAQLMAVFGWTDAKMPTLYTRSASRRRLAADSI